MTPEERARVQQLCLLIQSEQDHSKVSGLVNELDALLEGKERSLSEDNARILHSDAKHIAVPWPQNMNKGSLFMNAAPLGARKRGRQPAVRSSTPLLRRAFIMALGILLSLMNVSAMNV